MTFTDVDLSDHHQVTVTGVVASGVTTGLANNATLLGWLTLGTLTDTTGSGLGGSQPWNFSAQDQNFDYLAAGEKLTLTYTVQVDDLQGGVVSQDVVIVVTGTNDTPEIAVAGSDSAAATLTESYKTLSTAGTLTVTDVDLSDTVTATVKGVTLGGTKGGLTSADVLGMLSVTSGSIAANPTDTHNLAWSFNSNPQTFNFLDAGELLTLTYTVQVNDGHGGIANQTVTTHDPGHQSARSRHQLHGRGQPWLCRRTHAGHRACVGRRRRCHLPRHLPMAGLGTGLFVFPEPLGNG